MLNMKWPEIEHYPMFDLLSKKKKLFSKTWTNFDQKKKGKDMDQLEKLRNPKRKEKVHSQGGQPLEEGT